MPIYTWTSEHVRPESGRVTCYVPGIGRKYRSRLVYCNHNNVTLKEIEGMHVHHKDHDCTNDTPENLDLLEPSSHISDNHSDSGNGKRSDSAKEKMSRRMKREWADGTFKRKPRKRSYSDEIVAQIFERLNKGETRLSISKKLKIPKTTVYDIVAKVKKERGGE